MSTTKAEVMEKAKKINGNIETAIKTALERDYDNITENEHKNVRIQRIINTLNSIDGFGVCMYSEICKYRQ